MKATALNNTQEDASDLDVSYADRKRRDEALALLKLLSLSEASAKADELLSENDIMAKLEQRLTQALSTP